MNTTTTTIEALKSAEERIIELSKWAGVPAEGQTLDEIRVAIACEHTTERALRRVLSAIEGLSRIKNGQTFFEGSPTKDADCHAAWVELHDSRQEALRALCADQS